MNQMIKINDHITWVVAGSGQPQPGVGIKEKQTLLMPIIPTKEEEWILKSTNILWEKAATKVKSIHVSGEDVATAGSIILACLAPLGIFLASVGEVMVASMLSSICW